MPFLSNFAENELLDALTGVGSYGTTTAYLSLHDDDPGETGANEVTGGSYARNAVTFSAAASGATSNSSQEDFTDMPATTIYFAGLWDSLTTGNFLCAIPLGAGARVYAAADESTDVLTAMAHGFSTNDRVMVRASVAGTLPTGLSETTIYHVVTATTDTFQLSLTQGGGAVNFTTDGNVIAYQVEPRTVNSGDTVQFPTTNVALSLD